jgi:outer membrane translocation and assembly module TamA
MRYTKRTIKEIHEFIVDEKIAGDGKQKKEYAQLLLNLTSEAGIFNLSAGFAGPQIRRRIIMMNSPRSRPVKKIIFILIIPVIISMLLSFSYLKNPSGQVVPNQRDETGRTVQETIGNITWTGNFVFGTDKLSAVFGLKKGDNYIPEEVNKRLKMSDIADLYFDSGYVFFKADYAENRHNGVVDLVISIYEGKTGRIGDVKLKANVIIDEDIRKLVNIHTGDLFSKSEILKLIYALAATGKFDKEKINPKPIVNQEKSTDEYAVIDLLVELTGI